MKYKISKSLWGDEQNIMDIYFNTKVLRYTSMGILTIKDYQYIFILSIGMKKTMKFYEL